MLGFRTVPWEAAQVRRFAILSSMLDHDLKQTNKLEKSEMRERESVCFCVDVSIAVSEISSWIRPAKDSWTDNFSVGATGRERVSLTG